MADEQPQARPVVLLFDKYGKPLVVKYPPQKQPIGFNADKIKDKTNDNLVSVEPVKTR